MEDKIIIREAVLEDRETIFNLYQELEDAYEIKPDQNNLEQAELWNKVRQDNRQVFLVAEIDGLVIGTLTLIIIPNLGHHGQPWATIDNVVVAVDFQDHGIGTELMAVAGKIAAEQKCYKLVLSSNLVRKEAHGFYEHLGWQQTHLGFSLALDKKKSQLV
ncbi:MAG: GNAT family N-acetyltransferase [Desulfitobacteriaceae bacterium]